MAYTELTCDEAGMSLEEMERRAIVKLPDGSWALQVVVITAPPVGGGDFSDDFSDDFFT